MEAAKQSHVSSKPINLPSCLLASCTSCRGFEFLPLKCLLLSEEQGTDTLQPLPGCYMDWTQAVPCHPHGSWQFPASRGRRRLQSTRNTGEKGENVPCRSALPLPAGASALCHASAHSWHAAAPFPRQEGQEETSLPSTGHPWKGASGVQVLQGPLSSLPDLISLGQTLCSSGRSCWGMRLPAEKWSFQTMHNTHIKI